MQNKIFSYIGLATKSGTIKSGEFSTEKAVKEGRAKLVIVAVDASDNTKKKFSNMCKFYHIPLFFYGEKTQLGHAMGKEFRASLALLDEHMSDAVIKQFHTGGREYGENESQRNSKEFEHNK